jgi:hypothetical protein
MNLLSTLAAVALAVPVLAFAQGMPNHGGHAGHGGEAAAQADTPATKAFRDINTRMPATWTSATPTMSTSISCAP